MMNDLLPEYDQLNQQIADYILSDLSISQATHHNVHLAFCDTLACGILALKNKDCLQRLGPVVPGAQMLCGASVPGTTWQLDPVQATFNLGTMNRWLDYNDYWGAQEWSHPSDNIASIWMITDYLSRATSATFSMASLWPWIIKAYEVQGIMAMDNAFNAVGIDHVILVKLASCAVVAGLLGCDRQQILQALSLVWVDGHPIRTYRHAPNTGARKSWAAGDAASRAVRLALMAKAGESGYPSAIDAKPWGFSALCMNNQTIHLSRELGDYIINHSSLKLPYPTEFHAQTALEAAIILHAEVVHRLDLIESIVIRTQASADRIINKSGPLHNPADRDHCLQYIVAIGLIKGSLHASDYEDEAAADPLIDQLRSRTRVIHDPTFTAQYHDPLSRAVPGAVQVFFKDGSYTNDIEVTYALGQPARRDEALVYLKKKLHQALVGHYHRSHVDVLQNVLLDLNQLGSMSIDQLTDLLCENIICDNNSSKNSYC